jgi:hypothetical protein
MLWKKGQLTLLNKVVGGALCMQKINLKSSWSLLGCRTFAKVTRKKHFFMKIENFPFPQVQNKHSIN